MTKIGKMILVFVAVALVTLVGATAALASGTNIAHGGFDASTDACLQCHDIHEASADYVLLRWGTVTDTCASCHMLYKENPGDLGSNANNPYLKGYQSGSTGLGSTGQADYGSVYNPGYGSTTTPYMPTTDVVSLNTTVGKEEVSLVGVSVGSRWSAYEIDLVDVPTTAGHRVQRKSPSDSMGAEWRFGDGTSQTADYIPGGNNKINAFDAAKLDGSTYSGGTGNTRGTTSSLAYEATGGLFCASCHTPHGDFGYARLTGTADETRTKRINEKLLSSRPNHSPEASAVVIATWTVDGGKWCGSCHDRRRSGGVLHNHPDSVCVNGCHGTEQDWNEYGESTLTVSNYDFPHTSNNGSLLVANPDKICVNCHVAGSLP